jgi:hypothetical protein
MAIRDQRHEMRRVFDPRTLRMVEVPPDPRLEPEFP